MNEIRRVVRSAEWRLLAIDLWRTLAITLSAAICALIVLRIVQQVLGLGITMAEWWRIALGAAGAAAAAAGVWSILRRTRGMAAARELDERAGLRESLSTAMFVSRSSDPWASAVVETAREKAVRLKVRDAMPIRAPSFWYVPPALLLSLVIVWFALPALDLLGRLRDREGIARQDHEVRRVVAQIREDEQKLKELAARANVNLDLEPTADDADKPPRTPEEARRTAIKKLTDLTEKLAQQKEGEQARQMAALRERMNQLKQPGPGPLDQMSRALARGDFRAAREELESLATKLNDGSLSKEQQEQLREQLEKLAEQMKKLAEDAKELESQLEKAGFGKEEAKRLAADPEALERALEQSPLSEEQKQRLIQMAKAQQQACQQCQGMGECLAAMAAGMGQAGMAGDGMNGMAGLAGRLSEMEMLAAEMDAREALWGEACQMLGAMASDMEGGQLAMSDRVSPWNAGESSNRFGHGSGGPGRSGGGLGIDGAEADVTIDKVKARTKLGAGPIIGSRLVHGDQVRGESVLEFGEVVESSARAASEALEANIVPREYHDAVKHYFGRLEARTKAAAQSEEGSGGGGR